MSNTLGNPTLVSDKFREGQVLSGNASLTSSPSIANPLLRLREGSTTLVDFPLDDTTPLTGGSVDGDVTYNFVSPTAVAAGGAASLADNYQVIGMDNAVHLSGPATSTDAITVGQTVSAGTTTLTAPAS